MKRKLPFSARFFRLYLPLVATAVGPRVGAQEFLFTLAPSAYHFELGSKFAAVGDLNGDGVADLAVADRSAHIGSFLSSGVVHLVSGADGSTLRDYFGQPAASGLCGAALAALDADGDGLADLAVGSPGQADSVGNFGAGAVRVYSGASGSLLWTAAGPAGSQLGSSLSNAGDQNGDGVDDLYAGAPYANQSRGAVLVLSGADGSKLREIGTDVGASSFATTLATLGDIDGDGRPDLAAGAPGFRVVGGNPVGRILLVRSSDGAVAAQASGNTAIAANRLGQSLAATPDLNGDGRPDLLAGSYSGGTALLLSGADLTVLRDLSIAGLPANRALTVGGSLDLDGDGAADFLLGSPALQTVDGKQLGGIRVVSGRDATSLFEFTAAAPLSGLGLSIAVLPGLGFAAGEPSRIDPLTNGRGFAHVWKVASDADGDGVPDNRDLFPRSVTTPTVLILGVDSGVSNRVNEDGVTLGDRIAQLGGPSSYQVPAHYHVALVHLVTDLVQAGLLSRAEASRITAADIDALKPLRGNKR